MNAAKCRVILKPADLTPEQCALLREKLQSAVIWQQELAGKSPHVLQFEGELQESEKAFLIAHEPAEAAWDAAALFDSKSPEIDDTKKLVRLAAALLDALKSAHGGPSSALGAHGGLCPGVLLVSPDGLEKTTDFGFAGAFCRVLGSEAYLNLAVGPHADMTAAHNATGVWEVLSPDEFEREDRLCAFVDPEKYGTASFEGFEPGSDIIAAGFILHLIAEHRHPYLLDPEAHRLVELAEIMSMTRYNGARRKDLRESSDPHVVAWCGLVQDMLSRIPANRPTAAKMTASLAEFVPRVDQGELLRRKVETAQALADEQKWQELRSALAGIPDNDSAPDDVRENARGLLQLADANVLLDRAVEVMKTDQWPQAKDPLEKVLALPALPKSVAERARKASGLLDHNLGISDRLSAGQETIDASPTDDPESARDLLQAVVDESRSLLADEATFPILKEAVQHQEEKAVEKLASLEAELAQLEAQQREEEAQRERERAENLKQAQAWCDLLESALAEKKWDELADHLDKKPAITSWPKPVDERASEIKAALKAHVAQEERKAAEKADRQAALTWIVPAQEAAGSGAWDEVERLLAAKPELQFFPEDVDAQAQELDKSLADYRRREKDRLQAEEYVKRLGVLVERESWVEAADLLGSRPALEFWPDGSLEEEALLKSEIEEHLEAIELQKRQIAAWMDSAEAAQNQKRFAEAIQTLRQPPLDGKQIPKEVRTQATHLIAQCEKALAEQRKRELETKTRAIKDVVATFLTASAEKSLRELIQPTALDVKMGETVFDDPDALKGGHVSVDISLGDAAVGKKGEFISLTIRFEFNEDTPRLLDESKQRDLLIQGVTQAVADRQVSTIEAVIGGLQQGVFPDAELVAHFDPPSADVQATLHLMGRKSENGTLDAALSWDTKGMRWTFSDAATVVGGVLREAAKSIQTALPQRLFESVPDLKAYESRVAFDAVAGELRDATQLPEVLPLIARLSIKNDDGVLGSPIAEVALPLRSAGTIPNDFDAKPLVVALNKKIVAAQSSSREEMLTDLKRRAGEADPKAKAWATPAKIVEPTGTITFELGRKKKKPAARLVGHWQTDDFRYVLDEPYDNAISKVKDVATTGSKKPGLALVAVLVVVLGAGGYFGSMMLKGGETVGQGKPGSIVNRNTNSGAVEMRGNDNGTDPPSGNEPQNVKVEADIADAVSAVRNILRSDLLDPIKMQLVSSEKSDGESPATITWHIPGLGEPETTIRLDLGAKSTNWAVPAAEKQKLVDAVARLQASTTIDAAALSEVREALLDSVDAATLSPFVTLADLAYHLDAPRRQGWNYDAANDRWTTGSLRGSLRVGDNGPKLLTSSTTWYSEGGTRRYEAVDSDGPAIHAAVLQHQTDSANALSTQLTNWVGNARVVGPSDMTSLQIEVGLTVSADGLLDRTFVAAWDSKALQFEPDQAAESTWEPRARFIAAASTALSMVNDKANDVWATRKPRWLDDAAGQLVEQEAPKPGSDWKLMVAALWSATGQTVREVRQNERLLLSVPYDQAEGLDGPALGVLLADSAPQYWPAVKAHAIVDTNPFFSREEPFRTSLAEALAVPPIDLKHVAVRMSVLSQTPVDGNTPDDPIQGVAVLLEAKWSVADSPEGMLATQLQAEVEANGATAEPTLTLGVNESGELTTQWGDVSVLGESLAKMRTLEVVLADVPERLKLETELLGKLDNAPLGQLELSPDEALAWLREIRGIKIRGMNGAVPAGQASRPEDLKSLPELFASLARLTRDELFEKPRVVPSLFVEYFCGPRNCFAVACGLIDENNAPTVRSYAFKLCPSNSLTALDEAALGDQLLGKVLDAFPQVLTPDLQSEPKRSEQFGVVLGLDGPMSMVELPKLPFNGITPRYRELGNDDSTPPKRPFTRLNDFHDHLSGLKCEFVLVEYIGANQLWQRQGTDDEKWAYQTIHAAVAP